MKIDWEADMALDRGDYVQVDRAVDKFERDHAAQKKRILTGARQGDTESIAALWNLYRCRIVYTKGGR